MKDFKHLSKKEIEEKIIEIFSLNPSSKKVKKAKLLLMSKSIKIGALRKKFCKKCYSLFSSKNSKIRIKKPIKIIKCRNCGYITRYKLNTKN